MKRIICAALAVGACVAAAGAAQAQDDDWELVENPAQQLTVAAARYDGGSAIIAQCRAGGLTLVMAGLPQAATVFDLQASRADGRRDTQTWAPAGSPGAYRSTVPARDLRFLRGGGAYVIRTADDAPTAFSGTFDLPTQSANLDRVLTACGWPLTDDRDLLSLAQDVTFSNPDSAQGRRRMPTRRGATSRSPRREIEAPPPSAPPPQVAEHFVSCIVRDMHLRECRAVHPPSESEVAANVRSSEGRQIWSAVDAEPASLEGRVVYHMTSTMLIIDYIR